MTSLQLTPNVKCAMYCTDPKLVELIGYNENIRSRREKAIRILIRCRKSGLLGCYVYFKQYELYSTFSFAKLTNSNTIETLN